MKIGWGSETPRADGRRVVAVCILALLVISVVLLSGLFDATQARVAEQGTYCLRAGRTYNMNGDEVKTGRWSDNGGGNWYE